MLVPPVISKIVDVTVRGLVPAEKGVPPRNPVLIEASAITCWFVLSEIGAGWGTACDDVEAARNANAPITVALKPIAAADCLSSGLGMFFIRLHSSMCRSFVVRLVVFFSGHGAFARWVLLLVRGKIGGGYSDV